MYDLGFLTDTAATFEQKLGAELKRGVLGPTHAQSIRDVDDKARLREYLKRLKGLRPHQRQLGLDYEFFRLSNWLPEEPLDTFNIFASNEKLKKQLADVVAKELYRNKRNLRRRRESVGQDVQYSRSQIDLFFKPDQGAESRGIYRLRGDVRIVPFSGAALKQGDSIRQEANLKAKFAIEWVGVNAQGSFGNRNLFFELDEAIMVPSAATTATDGQSNGQTAQLAFPFSSNPSLGSILEDMLQKSATIRPEKK